MALYECGRRTTEGWRSNWCRRFESTRIRCPDSWPMYRLLEPASRAPSAFVFAFEGHGTWTTLARTPPSHCQRWEGASYRSPEVRARHIQTVSAWAAPY